MESRLEGVGVEYPIVVDWEGEYPIVVENGELLSGTGKMVTIGYLILGFYYYRVLCAIGY